MYGYAVRVASARVRCLRTNRVISTPLTAEDASEFEAG